MATLTFSTLFTNIEGPSSKYSNLPWIMTAPNVERMMKCWVVEEVGGQHMSDKREVNMFCCRKPANAYVHESQP